jgi:hypothetical protein
MNPVCDLTFNYSHASTSTGIIPYDALCISSLLHQLNVIDE